MRTLAPAFLSVGALAAWMPRALSPGVPGEAARALGEPLKSSSRLTTCVLEPVAAAARFFLGVLAWGGAACLGLGLGVGVAVAVGWGLGIGLGSRLGLELALGGDLGSGLGSGLRFR